MFIFNNPCKMHEPTSGQLSTGGVNSIKTPSGHDTDFRHTLLACRWTNMVNSFYRLKKNILWRIQRKEVALTLLNVHLTGFIENYAY